MSEHRSPNLLVLGGPSSGKTTYRTQLYQRVEHHNGSLKLLRSVEDMTGLKTDVDRIVQGLQPMHTNVDVYHTTTLLLEDTDKRSISLKFADYGGEQVRQIGESNVVPTPWVERAKECSGWLFFLRIDQIRPIKSFMTEPIDTGEKPDPKESSPNYEQSLDLNGIETLQRLLFVRRTHFDTPLKSPKLGVLLSCWDELPIDEQRQTPSAVLKHRAPLFYQFVLSNWLSDGLRIWGLSSTETQLPTETPNIDFASKGPENMGYIVMEDGRRSPDLTIPLSWLITNGLA